MVTIGSPFATDTFVGPASGGAFNISAPDTFTVGPYNGRAIENLTGDVGNEDTFFFAADGDLSGRIDGNAGGFDSLVIEEGFSMSDLERVVAAMAGACAEVGVSVVTGDDLLNENYPAIHAVGRASARAPRLPAC